MLRSFVVVAAIVALAVPAQAQLAPMKMTGVYKQTLKGKARVAIPSYGISFITSQKANANASLTAQSSLEASLQGVDEPTMRQLADEALADLKAQLTTAGIAVASDDDARSVLVAAAAPLRPDNRDDKKIGGGITFGKTKIRKGYVTVGASAAPLTTLFQSGGTPNAFSMLSTLGNTGKLYAPAEKIDALLIFPVMTVDFADTEARTGVSLSGSRRASIDSEVRFIVRQESRVDTALPMLKGRSGAPGSFTLARNYESEEPFTLGAASASATSTDARQMMDQGYDRKSGGVRVDLPKYVALVQQAYRAYNAAIVEALKSTRS
jgi:hypothetical protein